MQKSKRLFRILCGLLCSGLLCASAPLPAFADEAATDTSNADNTMIAHDPNRDIQSEGVGNPFGYGERNTPADAPTAEIRAINRAMTVQEVKYSLYKEIDEHWNLVSVRLGQTERERVYALILGVATRESTLGGNGDGADWETAFSQGFGVSSGHAYGPLQTAVTAFSGCDPTFMQEDDVPEMFQYSFTESNFYDCIISNHMGIRKILHFVRESIVDDGQSGYQVVRGALKGFNTGWATYLPDDGGYYKNYPDEIIAMARYYYEEGHLYDNVFTWTCAEQLADYRNVENVWDWWGDGEPSLAEITEKQTPQPISGDVDEDGNVTVADAVLLCRWLVRDAELTEAQRQRADLNTDGTVNAFDAGLLKAMLCVDESR